MDPVKLPELVANKVLNYLDVKEIFIAMEVCKNWRDFIKIRVLLTDKVIFKPILSDCGIHLVKATLSENIKRPYRHLVGPLGFKIENTMIDLVPSYADTLETLTIDWLENHHCDSNNYTLPQCHFRKLRKLVFLFCIPFSQLVDSTFPALTHLVIKGEHQNFKDINLNENQKFIRSLPNLQVLVLVFIEYHVKADFVDASSCSLTPEPVRPKIKEIYAEKYWPFLREYHLSLEKLEIYHASQLDICLVFQDLKVLKKFNVASMDHVEVSELFHYEQNTSIQSFQIIWNGDDYEKEEEILKILLALPFLQEFVIDSISQNTLKFVGM